MTLKITVECDARNCRNETEVQDNHDSAIEIEGWTVHPDGGYMHYCPSFWPKVEKEIKNDEISQAR